MVSVVCGVSRALAPGGASRRGHHRRGGWTLVHMDGACGCRTKAPVDRGAAGRYVAVPCTLPEKGADKPNRVRELDPRAAGNVLYVWPSCTLLRGVAFSAFCLPYT